MKQEKAGLVMQLLKDSCRWHPLVTQRATKWSSYSMTYKKKGNSLLDFIINVSLIDFIAKVAQHTLADRLIKTYSLG